MKNVSRLVSGMLLRRGWPRMSGRIGGLLLDDTAEVARDKWGIPHITAHSMHDLFFAQGYVHAQDRLWQMETMRRVSEGRLSEIAGAQTVAVDWFCRMSGMPDMKSRSAAGLSEEERGHCQAYADGVNACVSAMGRRLPLEFSSMKFSPAPWSVEDCFSVLPYIAFTQTFWSWAEELLAVARAGRVTEEEWNDMFPSYPCAMLPHEEWFNRADGLKFGAITPSALAFHIGLLGPHAASEIVRAVVAAAGPGAGSNNWVVAEGEDGRPILANDPHLGVSLPSVWYFCHLCLPGVLNVAGASLAGSPGVAIGRNERVGWAVTNFMLDSVDILTYRVDPDDPTLYFTTSGPQRMRQEQVAIGLPKGQSVKLPLHLTDKGPVVTSVDKGVNAIAVMRWYGTIPAQALQDRSFRGVLGFMRARSVGELLEAAGNWKYVSMNFVAADVEGHIGWHVSGAAPVRTGYSGRLPADASAGADWSGFLPFEAMPHVRDPEEGYIVTANYRPEKYPDDAVLSHIWCAPYRQQRITTAVRGMRGPGVRDFQALQMDVHCAQADRILPALERLTFEDPRAVDAARLLAGWDREVRKESAAAAVFEVFLTELIRHLLGGNLGDDLDLYFNAISYGVENDILEKPQSPLWKGKMETEVETVLARTMDFCESLMGRDRSQWRWGRLHRHVFRHPGAASKLTAWLLNPPEAPADGDFYTINVSWPLRSNGSYEVVTVPSMRMIASLGDPDGLLVIGPLGQSGQPGHRHYRDLTEMWLEGKYLRIPLTEGGARKIAVKKLVLAKD
jgi:penicillin G amidase